MSRTLAAVVMAALATTPLVGQTTWQREAGERLRLIAADAAAQGWRLTGESFTGELRAGDRDTLRVALRDGVDYALAAVCDGDCRDLALTVLDENDAILARSGSGGATSPLELRPVARGKYRVVVTMGRCGTGPCPYGIGILTK